MSKALLVQGILFHSYNAEFPTFQTNLRNGNVKCQEVTFYNMVHLEVLPWEKNLGFCRGHENPISALDSTSGVHLVGVFLALSLV